MKITLMGMGRVGSTLAYTLVSRGLGEELVLVDQNRKAAEGEALDLTHMEAFTGHPTAVRAGSIEDTAGSEVIVMTCSVPWSSRYKSRFDIGADNRRMFEEIIPPLVKGSPNAKILVVSNPVDVMTYHALKLSGLGPRRVFGTGTLIDSARFRTLLSGQLGIHPDDVRAYILGEHGESQFPVFSSAVAGGTRIAENAVTDEAFSQACRAGWEVVNRKGHTNFAVSMAVALVVEAIAWDTRRTMPLSVLVEGYLGISDICLSLPVVMGRDGIVRVLEPDLGPEEKAAMLKSAETVREAIRTSNETATSPCPRD